LTNVDEGGTKAVYAISNDELKVMRFPSRPTAAPVNNPVRRDAFTIFELLAVIAIIAILAAVLLPALSGARERSRGVYCLNNTRQLTLAWQLYADDHEGFLPYNLSLQGSVRTNINWVNDVMTWDLSSDNTNLATITQASLGPYVLSDPSIYHCPSDQVLSSEQQQAGWTHRIRSYSLNAMLGNIGSAYVNGQNVNNPGYRQFFKIEQMPRTSEIFTFLDEHPDSIQDGFFVDRDQAASGYGASSVPIDEWQNLPASYHDGSGSFSFADGHAALHRWQSRTTLLPAVAYQVSVFPLQLTSSINDRNDFEWVIDHMSVEK
jgi:prepilin-type N-terminal cleavage/methylation domain-containing protein/prepilin-type processing-associated H-X9-DG protein